MIAVIFEVCPHEDEKQSYLDMASAMLPLAEKIDGFITVERFQSLSHPEKLLSISIFDDASALDEWRQLSAHRNAQRAGRQQMFKDYRLLVAHVIRDYGKFERAEAPVDSWRPMMVSNRCPVEL